MNMCVYLQNDASADSFEKKIKQLLEIGNGKLAMDDSTQCITLPNYFCNITVTTKELIEKIFPNQTQNYRLHQKLSVGPGISKPSIAPALYLNTRFLIGSFEFRDNIFIFINIIII